jgi:hypothetical protein
MAEEIFDVVLQSTDPFTPRLEDWERLPPPENDFFFNADFWIGRLPHGIKCAAVMDACEPTGFQFHPIRQFGCRYAFCRRVRPYGSDFYSWDSDNFLGRLLFISRLIHPTTIARHFSARLVFEDDELRMIVPGHVQGVGTHVWIVATEWRDWLSGAEVEQLRESIARYILDAPERVRRARAHIDHAFHAFYVDQRTASLVSAFESLLKVERIQATAQFKRRVSMLASMVGLEITPDEADAFYDDRSVFVHGREPNYTELSDELIDRYGRFEATLRHALLRASTDVQFCGLFTSDATVAGAFGSLP